MGLSTNVYTYAGGAQQFLVNFSLGFIQRSDVQVRVNNAVDGFGDPVYANIVWIDDTTVEVTDTLVIGDSVEVVRTVSKTELLVSFSNNADVTPANLDVSAKQVLMAYQELVDGRVEGGVSPEASASAAETSAAAALVSETNADASEAAALVSENNAAASAAAALVSENNAASSEAAAAVSAAAALVSEGAASTSETNAATSASNAGTSETNAAASEGAASISETNAATSETNAGTSETNAAASEVAAAASAAAAATFNPANFAPIVHTHAIADVTDLQTELNTLTAGLANAGGGFYKGENGDVGGAAGRGDIFRVTEQELNTDVTIGATENASATGPLAIASGTTLTITAGGNLSIV